MKTLVIIDDEIFFRKTICKFLSAQNSYHILGEVNNGKSGMDLILEQKPDIAIVDISMPIMNGLEMIQHLYSRCHTKFVLLTGFADFEYAKQAIALGVKNYLLKPLDFQELTACLNKLSNEIDSDFNRDCLISDYFRIRDVYKNQMKQNFFHKIIAGNCQPEELSVLQKQIGLNPNTNYMTLLLKINPTPTSNTVWDLNADLSLLHSIIENICTEILGTRNFHPLYIDYSRLHQYLILSSTSIDLSDLQEQCSLVASVLAQAAQISVTFFCGTLHSGVLGIRHSYEETLSVLNNHAVPSSDLFISFHHSETDTEPVISSEDYQKILQLLRQKNKDALIDYFKGSFEKVRKHGFHIRQIWSLASILLTLLDSFITECGQNESEYPSVKNAFDTYQNCENIEQLHNLLLHVFLSVLKQQEQNSRTEKSSLISNVQEYIQKNFALPDLRLESIALHFYISPQYLSTLFSKETGITLTAYITSLRMEKAKELLLSDTPSIQNAATLCGFTDSSYFSKCFRKQYGISPKNFLLLRKKN